MDPATGRQLILTGSAKTEADAIALRDGFRKQIESQTAVRTNVTLAVLLDRVVGQPPGRAQHAPRVHDVDREVHPPGAG